MGTCWALKKAIKNPVRQRTGFTVRSSAILPVPSFGCFKRIDFGLLYRRRLGHMRCQVASAVFPFYCRIRTRCAKPTGSKLGISIASFTLLYDLMANPAVEGTTFCRHKRAFQALFNTCTNQWNHLLSVYLAT